MLWVYEASTINTLWSRELRRFLQERSRLAGALLQPLLFWWVIGFGMAPSFQSAKDPSVSYIQYFFPGVVVMMVLFNAIFSTMSLVEDRREGLLHAILVAPGSRFSVVLGKSLGTSSIALIQAFALLALCPLAGFELLEVSWLSLFFVLLLGALCLALLGFGVAWWINSTQGYHVVMSLFLLPLWVVSGSLFPLPTTGFVGKLTLLNPMTHLLEASRLAMNGQPIAVFTWAALASFVGIFLSIAVWVSYAKK